MATSSPNAISTTLTDATDISRETVRRRLGENALKPWQRDMWCIPQVDGTYVARMEDVLDLHAEAPVPSVFLILAAVAPTLPLVVALLVLRSLLSQMDVPTRSSYVMAIVQPAERPAAASVTAVPRSLAASLSPALAGWMIAASPFSWPLVCAGVLKVVYDLALLRSFQSVLPPEEAMFDTGAPR